MEWISIKDKLPKDLETVWLCNIEKNWVWLGCIIDSGEGWVWAVCENGLIYSEGNNIVAECETDDYDVTHWIPLPKLPSSE